MTTDTYTHDVFLAFASQDAEAAAKLEQYLKSEGLRVYSHKKSIAGGEVYADALPEAQRESLFTVLFLSSTLLNSTPKNDFHNQHAYLAYEIAFAVHLGQLRGSSCLIPVCLAETQPAIDQLPYPVSPFQLLLASSEKALDKVAEQIAKRIRDYKPAPSEAPPLDASSGVVVSGHVQGCSTLDRDDLLSLATLAADCFAASLTSYQLRWIDVRGGVFLLFVSQLDSGSKSGEVLADVLLAALSCHRQVQEALPRIFDPARDLHLILALDWEDNCTEHAIGTDVFPLGLGLVHAPALAGFCTRPHVLLAEHAFYLLKRHYGPQQEDIEAKLRNRWATKLRIPEISTDRLPLKVHFAELVFLDKRKVQHSAYRVHVTDSDGITVCGDDSPHQEQILIEYRTPQSDPKNVFCRRLVEYDDICIIGVTNENLVTKFLEPALEERNARGKGFWDRILVIFPTRDSIERVRDQINVAAYRKVEARGGRLSDTDNAASKRRVANWETGRRRVMNFLLQQDTSGRSSDCLEYSGLIPFIGQRFRSPSTRSLASSVRISPILPGADVKKNFYIEVFEKQGTFSPISNALETVFSNSRPLIEWHVHGLNATSSEQNAAFTVCGIIRDRRRKSLSRHLDQHFLLVLVLLHVLDNTGHYIVLQERTPLNASSDFGLLSNISGWVTDRDLFSGLERRLDPDYAEANFATPSGNVPHDDEASQALMRSLCDGSDSQRYALTEEQLDSVAQKAAMREIYEELGLDKTPQRLGKTLILDGDAEKREPAMFFRLFHIQLYPQDCRMVAQNRPDAKLERFRLRDLTKLKKEEDIGSEQHFNHLLRAHFESDFKQIYADLVNGSS